MLRLHILIWKNHLSLSSYIHSWFSFQMMSSMAHNWDASGSLLNHCRSKNLEQYPVFGHMRTNLSLFVLCHVPLNYDNKILFPTWREREQSALDFGNEPTGSAKWIKTVCKCALRTKQFMPVTHCFQVGILILVPRTHISSCFNCY